MPRRKLHKKIDLLFLGYHNPLVHEIIDSASKSLGSGHRIFGHSAKILDFIGEFWGPKARKQALLHILLDTQILNISQDLIKNIKRIRRNKKL